MRKVDLKETSCLAADLSLPFGAAAAIVVADGLGVVDVVSIPEFTVGVVDVVSLPEFAVGVTDALLLLDDGFGAPFPLA